MAKAVWTKFITDSTTGAAVTGASVTVFLSDGITPAAIFSDAAGSAKSNPFLTPAGGKAEFYADPGLYVIQASKDAQTVTWNQEEIGMARRDNDLSDLDSAVTARSNLGLKSAAVADILGTVSQSGGVPTGALVEYGSNASGQYWKYAGGDMICKTIARLTGQRNQAVGSLFYSGLLGPFTWPAVFADKPVSYANTYDSEIGFFGILGSETTIFARAYSPSSTVVEHNYQVVGIGRWY